jgi:predicted nucleotidyltransferase
MTSHGTIMMDTKRLDDVCRRHRIVLLVQFGSTVEGRVHPGSDLDLAALTERRPSTDDFLAMLADLDRAFPGQEVDLCSLNAADPLFLKKILERSRLLHGSPRRLAEMKLYAFRRYQDHRRFLALEQQYVNGKLRRRVTR